MNDLDKFSAHEIFAITLIGEFESMGETGMIEGACVVMNRVKANRNWMGGRDVRKVCLRPFQFSCWNSGSNKNRERIVNIAQTNPTYGPYVMALRIASDAMAGHIVDVTHNAVSYINHLECDPKWAQGKTPCFIDEPCWFYDMKAVS